MTERGILFSAPMVRAILGGTKTQTRRVVANRNTRYAETFFVQEDGSWWPYATDDCESHICYDGNERPMASPYGVPGDRLWVREAWTAHWGPGAIHREPGRLVTDALIPQHDAPAYQATPADPLRVYYAADNAERPLPHLKWRPAIHMPRWASRITLEVTGVRVERLQDISDADCMAEGITSRRVSTGDARTGCMNAYSVEGAHDALYPRGSYELLWESINGPGSWEANPWVWVVEFRQTAQAAGSTQTGGPANAEVSG